MSSELSHVRFEPLFKRGGGGCGDVILVSSRLFDANLIGESQLELKWIEFGTVNHSRSHFRTFTVTAAVSLIFFEGAVVVGIVNFSSPKFATALFIIYILFRCGC